MDESKLGVLDLVDDVSSLHDLRDGKWALIWSRKDVNVAKTKNSPKFRKCCSCFPQSDNQYFSVTSSIFSNHSNQVAKFFTFFYLFIVNYNIIWVCPVMNVTCLAIVFVSALTVISKQFTSHALGVI